MNSKKPIFQRAVSVFLAMALTLTGIFTANGVMDNRQASAASFESDVPSNGKVPTISTDSEGNIYTLQPGDEVSWDYGEGAGTRFRVLKNDGTYLTLMFLNGIDNTAYGKDWGTYGFSGSATNSLTAKSVGSATETLEESTQTVTADVTASLKTDSLTSNIVDNVNNAGINSGFYKSLSATEKAAIQTVTTATNSLTQTAESVYKSSKTANNTLYSEAKKNTLFHAMSLEEMLRYEGVNSYDELAAGNGNGYTVAPTDYYLLDYVGAYANNKSGTTQNASRFDWAGDIWTASEATGTGYANQTIAAFTVSNSASATASYSPKCSNSSASYNHVTAKATGETKTISHSISNGATAFIVPQSWTDNTLGSYVLSRTTSRGDGAIQEARIGNINVEKTATNAATTMTATGGFVAQTKSYDFSAKASTTCGGGFIISPGEDRPPCPPKPCSGTVTWTLTNPTGTIAAKSSSSTTTFAAAEKGISLKVAANTKDVYPVFSIKESEWSEHSFTLYKSAGGAGASFLLAQPNHGVGAELYAYTESGDGVRAEYIDGEANTIESEEIKGMTLKGIVGRTYAIEYSGVNNEGKSGEVKYISAAILEENGDVLYFGKLGYVPKSKKEGTVNITVPTLSPYSTYILALFEETVNSAGNTTCSMPVTAFLEVDTKDASSSDEWMTDTQDGILWRYQLDDSGNAINVHTLENPDAIIDESGCMNIPVSIGKNKYPVASIGGGSADTTFVPKEYGGYNSIKFPATCSKINPYAFYCCKAGLNLVIPSQIQSIGQKAFYNASALRSVEIKDATCFIDKQAFAKTAKMQNVSIVNATVDTGEYAFADAQSLDTVTFSNSNVKVGSYAFASSNTKTFCCTGNNLELGDHAFYQNRALTQVSIFGQAEVGEYAFSGALSLIGIKVDQMEGTIKAYAFENADSLKMLYLPNTVTAEGFAFSNCDELAELELDVTNLVNHTFASCPSITKIILDSHVQNVAYNWGGYNENASEGNIENSASQISSNKGSKREFYIFNRNTQLQFAKDGSGNYYSALGFKRTNSDTNANHNFYRSTKVYYSTLQDLNGDSSDTQEDISTATCVSANGETLLTASPEDLQSGSSLLTSGIAITGGEEASLNTEEVGYLLDAHMAGVLDEVVDAAEDESVKVKFGQQDYTTPTVQTGIGASYPTDVNYKATINKENFTVYPVYNDGTPYNEPYTVEQFYVIDQNALNEAVNNTESLDSSLAGELIAHTVDGKVQFTGKETISEQMKEFLISCAGDDSKITPVTIAEDSGTAVQNLFVFVLDESEELTLLSANVDITIVKESSSFQDLVNEYGSIEEIMAKIEELKQAEANAKQAIEEAQAESAKAKAEVAKAQEELDRINKALAGTITEDGKIEVSEGQSATEIIEDCNNKISNNEQIIQNANDKIAAADEILNSETATEEEKQQAQAEKDQAQQEILEASGNMEALEALKKAYEAAAEVERLKVENKMMADDIANLKALYVSLVTGFNNLLGQDAAEFEDPADFEEVQAKADTVKELLRAHLGTIGDIESQYATLMQQLEDIFGGYDLDYEQGTSSAETYANMLNAVKALLDEYKVNSENYNKVLESIYGENYKNANHSIDEVLQAIQNTNASADEQLKAIQEAIDGKKLEDGDAVRAYTILATDIATIKQNLSKQTEILQSVHALLDMAKTYDEAGKEDYEASIQSIKALAESAATYQQQVAEWQEKYSKLQSEYTAQSKELATLKAAANGTTSGTTSSNTTAVVSALQSQVTDLTTKNATLTNENKELTSTVNTLQNGIDEVYEEVLTNSQGAVTPKAASSSSNYANKLSKIKTYYTTLSSNYQKVEEENEALTEKNETLTATNKELKEDVTTYKNKYNTYKKKYDTVKGEKATLAQANTSLKNKNASLSNQVSSLENQVVGLRNSAPSNIREEEPENGTSQEENLQDKLPTAKTYTVTFLDEDGAELSSEEYKSGETIQYPEDPVKDGYSFVGWSENPVSAIMDYTLTAQYEENSQASVGGEFVPRNDEMKQPDAQDAISESHATDGEENSSGADGSTNGILANLDVSVSQIAVIAVVILLVGAYFLLTSKKKKAKAGTDEE